MIDPLRWASAALSRLTGRLADVPVPRPLRAPLFGPIATLLGMELDEAAQPSLSEYPTLDTLFVRSLRSGTRVWPDAPGVPASPVDGLVGSFGAIRAGRLLQAKGRQYTVAELLDDRPLALRFDGGVFLTLYLAPRHYHRIHAPVGGTIHYARHIPGRLLPVNTAAVRAVDRLFPRNERLVCVIEPPATAAAPVDTAGPGTVQGAVAVVAVGAFNVGRITAAFDPELVTNRRRARPETRRYDPPVAVDRGAEIMTFHLGSTVVMLFEQTLRLRTDLVAQQEIRLGGPLVDPSDIG